ncbi:hypothetical protein [Aeromicrobium sp. CTD01-1L150]|uniref:hypothetical protein n=1 Tax=Aeromicrobium sp. CTD01-1L150 TaxID=3341830 RepID=UPI0035BF30B5
MDETSFEIDQQQLAEGCRRFRPIDGPRTNRARRQTSASSATLVSSGAMPGTRAAAPEEPGWTHERHLPREVAFMRTG